MFTMSKRMFCLILIGLATLAVASLSSILHLEMDQAVMAFVATWLALIILFQSDALFRPHNASNRNPFPGGPTKQQ